MEKREILFQLLPKQNFSFSFSLTWSTKITKTKTEVKMNTTIQYRHIKTNDTQPKPLEIKWKMENRINK